MRLPSLVKFADDKARRVFLSLENGDARERELYRRLREALDNLEKNAFCGIQVPKRLIPKSYLRKYGVDNLWKLNLPAGWRLLYSIRRDETNVISVILEWLTHKKYERRFGY